MRSGSCVTALLIVGSAALNTRADDTKDDGFVPMFNGKDLTGWVNVNCAPGTFFVKDGEIITTGKPTGYLRTEKQYENFIADFEWMHVNKKEVGNSGFFVWADPLPGVGTPYTRGIEVQVLVNLEKAGYYTSQGDLFSIHGATCKPDRPHPHGWMRCLPSENRCKGGGEWNHYTVIAKDGTIKLHVNGKEVSGISECKPRKGYMALESEGAECHFRNLKIKELPSSNPKPEETADLANGFKNLFTGLDLSGWKADEEAKKHWQPRDWMLHYDGKGNELGTEQKYGDAEFIADFRFPKGDYDPRCTVRLRHGTDASVTVVLMQNGKLEITFPRATERSRFTVTIGPLMANLKPAGQWNRLDATLRGNVFNVKVNGKPSGQVDVGTASSLGRFALSAVGEMDFGNLFVRERKQGD
jgi:hypothetical protein